MTNKDGFESALYVEVQLLALSHTIFISCVTGPTEGKAINTDISNGNWMGPSIMEWCWC